MKYIILILSLWASASNAEESHFFIHGSFGKQGWELFHKSDDNWKGSKAIACAGMLGYRVPYSKVLWFDVTVRHSSHCDRGWPFNNRDEDAINSGMIGVEYRWY